MLHHPTVPSALQFESYTKSALVSAVKSHINAIGNQPIPSDRFDFQDCCVPSGLDLDWS
jgi:hypothetical protein